MNEQRDTDQDLASFLTPGLNKNTESENIIRVNKQNFFITIPFNQTAIWLS